MDTVLLNQLIELRHDLHRHPELSGEEEKTAIRIRSWLEQCSPTRIIDDFGGHGIAAIFASGEQGPTVLFRCELDALPIDEVGQPEWRSVIPGKAHLCGHDGHMAVFAGLANMLYENPPSKGKVILLFQPAEETGEGAQAIIKDKRFALIRSDFAFALHNLPGMKLHQVGIKSGSFNFASEGLSIHLTGHTSHASHPEDGNSPALAVAELINEFPAMPATLGLTQESALATIVHARLGTENFGISPGDACVMATVRSIDDDIQKKLLIHAEKLARQIAEYHNLEIKLSCCDRFAACTNNDIATQILQAVVEKNKLEYQNLSAPFRWSEDFGVFGATTKSMLCVLGSGYDCPQLHNPNYDFPDELIETGIKLFDGIVRNLCVEKNN
ncbi:MAG: amidohydrolase [Hyphomicrobiales bacterium]|nr:amidohydrolase [Hyphomicrobiales bacterium]